MPQARTRHPVEAPVEVEVVPLAPATVEPAAPARLGQPVLVVILLGAALLDAIMVDTAFVLAYYLRLSTDIIGVFIMPSAQVYGAMLAVLTGTLLAVFYFSGLYGLERGQSRVDQYYRIFTAVSSGTILSVALNSFILGDQFVYSRQILITGWALCIGLMAISRTAYSASLGWLRAHGVARDRLLVVGAGPIGREVVARAQRHPQLGYEVVGFLDDLHLDEVDGVPVLGSCSRLGEVVRKHQIDQVIVALSGSSHQHILDLVALCDDDRASIKVYPDAFQIMTKNEIDIDDLDGLPLVSVRDVALRGWNRALKRAFDVVFSALVLILTSPLVLLLALLVKVTSSGPAFHVQERVGLDGERFHMVKLRSMRANAEAETGPVWATPGDLRSTWIGRFMRRYSLDELPQFANVLMGDMSVVGPRPERPTFVEQFSQTVPRYMRRHREKAGITGWAQINGLRGDTSIEERTRYDLYYVENWSLLLDLKIIVRTLLRVFRDANAY